MGRVTVKEQAGNKKKHELLQLPQEVNECVQCDQSQLTDDHKAEKVSVEEVPQDWLVPCFHADHGSD